MLLPMPKHGFWVALQDNYPRMDLTALDLSPYYLYEARNNIKSWHKLRQPKLKMGGVDGSGTHFLQAAAESIPEDDASHDVVSSMITIMSIPYLHMCIESDVTSNKHVCLFCGCIDVCCQYYHLP